MKRPSYSYVYLHTICVLKNLFNAANETAVYAFLDGKIIFSDIYKIVTAVLESMGRDDDFTLDNLLAIDQWARIKASEFINRR